MAATTTNTKQSCVTVALCFILSFQKEPNYVEVFLKRCFYASLCLSKGHPGPCFKRSTTELATKPVGFCCDCVTVGLLCNSHNRTRCVTSSCADHSVTLLSDRKMWLAAKLSRRQHMTKYRDQLDYFLFGLLEWELCTRALGARFVVLISSGRFSRLVGRSVGQLS